MLFQTNADPEKCLFIWYILSAKHWWKFTSGALKQRSTNRQAKNKLCRGNTSTTTFADISRSFMDPFHEFSRSHMSPGSLTHVMLALNRYNASLAFLLHEHMSLVPPKPVLRIHHFGVDPDPRIHASDWWIRIRGSMPLTNGSVFGSGSCYFLH